MNPFAHRFVENSAVVPLSAGALVLGVMISLAWITQADRGTRMAGLSSDMKERISLGSLDVQEELKKLRDEVTKLRVDNTKLQNVMSKETGQSKILNESLQELKVFAGLTEVEGPGVNVTLKDSKPSVDGGPVTDNIIHDADVLKVTNELWNAGAEAIAVNGNRVGLGSNFRCVGTTILVDSQKIASPIVIQAIGAAKTLSGAMNLPDGILDQIRQTDPSMVSIAEVEYMKLPAYSGTTQRKHAKPVIEKEQDKGKK